MVSRLTVSYVRRRGGQALICGVAATLLVSGADAQSSTNCMAMGGGMVHCDTMDMSPQYNPPQSDGGAALGRGIGLFIARTRENSFRKKVGKMLAAGDCQGAMRYAYEKGHLELGQAIASSCPPSGGR